MLTVVRKGHPDKRRFCAEILEKAIDVHGLPWDAPAELHIVSEKEAGEYLRIGKRTESHIYRRSEI